VVLKLVPDGVCMVWAGFLEKPPEVVRRWHRLTHVAACSIRDAPHTRVACLTIIAIGCGHDPLKALLAPPLATFGALLGVTGGNVRRRLPITARGRLPASLGGVKHDYLVAGDTLGGNVVRLLERVPEEVTMSTLPRARCAVLNQRAHAVSTSLAVSLGLIVPFLLPSWGLGREISRG
jgi:hypothetical protein